MKSYHIGNLAFDRYKNPPVEAKAKAIWAAYLAGQVLLVQKRVSPGVCEYFTVPVAK